MSSSKHHGSGQGSKANVMTSINWVATFIGLALIYGVIYGTELWIKIFCSCLVMMGIFFYFGMFFYFAIRNPDRLQSEKYQIEKLTIDALYEKEGSIEDKKINFSSPPPSIQITDSKNIRPN